MDSGFYSNFKKSASYKALVWEKIFNFVLIKTLRKFLFFLFLMTAAMFLIALLSESLSKEQELLRFLLGISIIFLTFSVIGWRINLFIGSKLKNFGKEISLRSKDTNYVEFLGLDVARAAWKAKGSSRKLFYNLICGNKNMSFIFSRALLDISGIKKSLKENIKKEDSNQEDKDIFLQEMSEAFNIARKNNHKKIEIGDILVSVSKYDAFFKKILMDAELKSEDIENLTWWLESLEKRISNSKKFWEWKNLTRNGSIGKNWAAGYTLTLDQFSTDWTEIIRKRGSEDIIGSEDEVEVMERVLSQGHIHSVLLVGEPGVGRKGMIYDLAARINSGRSLPEINYKRVVALDIVSVLAQCQSFEEVEKMLDTIFNEAASAGNVILVIDEFYSFISQSSGKPGTVDISPIIMRYLSLPNFRVIGITSYLGLHLFIEKNPSIMKFFSKVETSEATEQETIMILENSSLGFEQKFKIFISYPAIRDVVKYAGRYIKDAPFPKKASDLLEEVVFYTTRYTKNKIVLPEYVSKIVSKKADIPVGDLEQKEKEVLLNLENLIHKKIINQKEAVSEVSSALRRARADITVRKGPIGCFLFLGPTGVGKTETSKALAEVYFGSEEKMIRLDMSEFQNVNDIPRLLGTTDQEGLLTTAIRENPFSLILLDEIEKSHPNILNLFLQVLDEGFLTDGLGRKTDFKNAIIIATSNAGYQMILDAIKDKKQMSEIKTDLLNNLFKEKVFRPEFINRFDSVVLFRSLGKENLLDIAELLLQKLKKNLKTKEIDFIITQGLKEKIVQLGYNPIFGARQMRRVIQDKIENVLAVALLSEQIKKGDKVEIDSEDFKLIKNKD